MSLTTSVSWLARQLVPYFSGKIYVAFAVYFYKKAGSPAFRSEISPWAIEISTYIKDRNRLEGMKNDKIIAESGDMQTEGHSYDQKWNDRLGATALSSFSLL